MKKAKITDKRLIWIILIIFILISVACVGNVKPEDPRLQAPVSTLAKVFKDFLQWLKLTLGGETTAPWITDPNNFEYGAEPSIEVTGWAKYYNDGKVVVYQVVPEDDLSRVKQVLNGRLSETIVDKETENWSLTVELPEERQFIAVRIERENKESSDFSNIIYISTGDEVELTISSPVNDEVISKETVNLEGNGEPGLGLEVYVNNENVRRTTQIGTSGKWGITDVPLIVSGFDKDSPTAEFKLKVRAEASEQEATVSIRRMDPISLVWPFGEGEGENYNPNLSTGSVTAFYQSDFHLKPKYGKNHFAMDISTTGGHNVGNQIHAVADGTVVQSGWDQYSGGYIVVDSGGFGVLYLHIMEGPIDDEYENQSSDECKDINTQEFSPKVEINNPVKKGQVIATEGFTHECRGNTTNYPTHLHIQVFIWGPNVDKSKASVYGQSAVNINPPISYKNDFSKKNINLYDWWGGSPYCANDGCWKDVNWLEVYVNPPNDEYADGCLAYLECLYNNCSDNYLWGTSTRLRYCRLHPEECSGCEKEDFNEKDECCP